MSVGAKVPQVPEGWVVTRKRGDTWISRVDDPTEVCIYLNARDNKFVWDGEYPYSAKSAREIGEALIACADLLGSMPGRESG